MLVRGSQQMVPTTPRYAFGRSSLLQQKQEWTFFICPADLKDTLHVWPCGQLHLTGHAGCGESGVYPRLVIGNSFFYSSSAGDEFSCFYSSSLACLLLLRQSLSKIGAKYAQLAKDVLISRRPTGTSHTCRACVHTGDSKSVSSNGNGTSPPVSKCH